MRANTLGFYALNGRSHVNFKNDSRAESFCEFFKEIGEKNPGKRILVILDNFSSHKAKTVQKTAEGLGITLVYLPPYSPNLNPIEYIWKALKRKNLHKVCVNKRRTDRANTRNVQRAVKKHELRNEPDQKIFEQ